jgi:hypothetical protein
MIESYRLDYEYSASVDLQALFLLTVQFSHGRGRGL